jgi:uncharacterized membrane protein YqiK
MKKTKETVKSVKAAYATYKALAQEFMFKLQHPPSRKILSVGAADAQGKLNGMTIAELIAITNLLSAQGEKLYLVPQGKSIIGYAVEDAPRAPWGLL